MEGFRNNKLETLKRFDRYMVQCLIDYFALGNIDLDDLGTLTKFF